MITTLGRRWAFSLFLALFLSGGRSGAEQLLWRFDRPGEIINPPAVAPSGEIVITSYFPDGAPELGTNGWLRVLSSGGEMQWERPLPGGYNQAPLVGPDGTIYVGGLDRVFRAVSLDNTVRWELIANEAITHGAALGRNGTVYFGAGPRTVWPGNLQAVLYAVGSSGELQWTNLLASEEPFEFAAAPSVGADGVVFVPGYFSVTTVAPPGRRLWRYNHGQACFGAAALNSVGGMVFGTSEYNAPGGLHLLTGSGLLKWKWSDFNSQATPVIGADGTVYIGGETNRFFALKVDNGEVVWSYETGAAVRQAAALGKQGIWITPEDGRLLALNYQGELKWSFEESAGATPSGDLAVTAQGHLVWGTSAGTLWCVDADDEPALEVWPQFQRDAGRQGQQPENTLPPLTAPEGLRVWEDSLQAGLVRLSWEPVLSARAYEMRRSATDDFDGATILATNITGTVSWTDLSPPYDTELYYWVRAVGIGQVGPISEPIKVRQTALLWSWSPTAALTAPVVMRNGLVVVGVRTANGNRTPETGWFFARTLEGDLAWSFNANANFLSEPVVSPDGRLVAGVSRQATNQYVISVNPDGSLHREVQAGGGGGSPPAIGNDGTLVILGRSPQQSTRVESYSIDGQLLWTANLGFIAAAPQFAIQSDGTVVVSSSTSLAAYSPNGTRQWSQGGINLGWGPPSLLSDERLVVLNTRNQLISYTMDGVAMWTNRISGPSGTPWGIAVDRQGNSYVADFGWNLHAIDPTGAQRWQLPLVEPTPFTPIITSDGQLLVVAGSAIAVVNAQDGVLVRRLPLPEMPTQPPVLTEEGTLLVVAGKRLMAMRISEGFDTEAPWPMARRDAQGTGARPGTVAIPELPQIEPPMVYANKVRLTLGPWTRPVGYELWRSETPDFAEAIKVASFLVGDTRIEDTTGEPNRTYHYWIRAQNLGGQSAFAGPVTAQSVAVPLKWRIPGAVQTPPAVAPDGTVYSTGSNGLTAINSEGMVVWSVPGLGGQPVVSMDGTVYLRTPDRLYSFSPSGATNWSLENTALRQTAPALGADGSVLVPGAGNQFAAYRPDSSIAWQFADDYFSESSPSVNSDGTIAYIGINREVIFRRPDGSLIHAQPTEAFYGAVSAPAWTPGGELIVQPETPSQVQKMDRSGTIAWAVDSQVPTLSPPAVAADGTIFSRLSLIDPPGTGAVPWIAALDSGGSLLWKRRTDTLFGTPVLTANGLLLVSGLTGVHAHRVEDGSLAWTLDASANNILSPVLSDDGTLLVPSAGFLEAFDLGVGPAAGPWPMHRQNPRQSASAVSVLTSLLLTLVELGESEIKLRVSGTAPSATLFRSFDLREWNSVVTFDLGASGQTNLTIPRAEGLQELYRVVAP